MNILSLQQILAHGLILSGLLGVLILGSLYYNPRLWLSDYPKAMQAKVPPLTRSEKQKRWVVFVLFIGAAMGTLYFSIAQLRAQNGGAIPFLAAYLNTFLVFNIFNLFDAVVLDWLILTVMKPKFAVLPGAEGMEYLYHDWRLHVGNYLKGIVFCAVFSLPVAFVATL